MLFDFDFWKQSEGQIVDSVYPLERCIGGGSRAAVFETQVQDRPAAIKIVPGKPESIAATLALWGKTAQLSHPALIRNYAHGQASLGNLSVAYLVMERAEENLADVLAERLLTPAETREMLTPLLDALQYLHARGYTHGALKPANVLATGDQLKISSDALVPGGDAAEDCRSVGLLLNDVLGANRNARLPEPFAGIASNCLTPDPAARWDLTRIEECLRSDSEPLEVAPSRARLWALAAAAAVVVGLFVFWPSQPKAPDQAATSPTPAATDIAAPPSAAPNGKAPAESKTAAAQKKPSPLAPKEQTSPSPPVERAQETAAQRPPSADGITRVLPDISRASRNTISGRVRINVRVRVDSAGNVSQASLERPLPSRYFSERALAAAQSWKFPAGNPPQDWMIRFELMRRQTNVSASKIGN